VTEADSLIKTLIEMRRDATSGEIALIRHRLREAPFSNQSLRVPPRERGLAYQGVELTDRADAGIVHLIRRVLIDEQWAYGTTLEEYLEDLRGVAADPSARLLVYDSGRGPVTGILGANNCPPPRLGPRPQPFIYVVYAVNRSRIITGYQTSSIDALDIPEDALWLT
jgi:hypothetical protein